MIGKSTVKANFAGVRHLEWAARTSFDRPDDLSPHKDAFVSGVDVEDLAADYLEKWLAADTAAESAEHCPDVTVSPDPQPAAPARVWNPGDPIATSQDVAAWNIFQGH